MSKALTGREIAISEAVERLQSATRDQVPCAPVRDLIGNADIDAAYAVQREIIHRRIDGGARVVGRKIGLTAEAVQTQLGVDQPDFGFLFEDMAYEGGDTMPWSAVLQPRAEAEVAFVLKSDLDHGDLDYTQVRGAIGYAVAALEVCGSRVANWDITFGDTVADNASAGAFVLGPSRRNLDAFEPRDCEMSMTVDGQVVSTGHGSACLGDPIEAVVWLARKAREFGDPLRAGQVVLSGALGPMVGLSPGSKVRATFSGLGAVQFCMSEESQ